MGNASCCSEGGHTLDTEYKSYHSNSRPVNQSTEKGFNVKQSFQKQYIEEDKNLLMAYTSGDQKKIVKIQSHYRGHNTRQRLDNGNQFIINQLDEYKSGNLMNVHNQRIDQASEESAVYSGQIMKNSQNVK